MSRAMSGERAARRAALMARAQDGDAEAYRELLEDIRPALLHLLRSWATDRHELEDLVQDTLMSLHRARHTYDSARPFEPWLFAIARHVALRHRRVRLRRAARQVLVDELPEMPVDAGPGTPQHLDDLLERLSPAQREAFELLKIEGLSADEAARRARTTVGTLRVRAHRAYRTIRRLLERP